MVKQLAIKGHPTRGNEVIKLLEMMGGHNGSNLLGNKSDYAYFITDSGDIGCSGYTNHISIDYFTLEEFCEKFPFKVGDKVRVEELYAPISKMEWDPIHQEFRYLVSILATPNEVTIQWYTAKELMKWNAKFRVDEEKNGLKTMFEKHDIVTVVAKGGRSRWICEYKSAKFDQLSYYKGTYVVTDDDYKEDLMYDSNYDISPTDTIRLATPAEATLFERIVRKIEKPNILADLLDHLKTTSKEDLEKEFEEIKEWSNVGPTVEEFRAFCESVNRKPKYPTTYEDCCEILGIRSYFEPEIRNVTTGESLLFSKLIRLKRCRDAYWKIAGDKMLLDGPWKPDWNDLNRKYFISLTCDGIGLYDDFRNPQILTFPTEEMRDAFYKNFKDLIEQCKELL